MKYLSDYTQEATTKALNAHGAFWAFSQSQFNEQKKEGVKYVTMGSGLVCKSGHSQALADDLDAVRAAGIAQDIAENGLDGIIKRELYNHECFYTGDWQECAVQGAFSGYDIPDADVLRVYRAEYPNASKDM